MARNPAPQMEQTPHARTKSLGVAKPMAIGKSKKWDRLRNAIGTSSLTIN